MTPLSRFDRNRRSTAVAVSCLFDKPLLHPLPKRLLPEARGIRVTRLRASLRRPPSAQPSLS